MKFFIEDDNGTRTELVPTTGVAFSRASATAGTAITSGHFDNGVTPIDLLAQTSKQYTTVGAGSGPCKATIRVVPGLPSIVTATFGPAAGTNFATMHASIAGVPLPERGDGIAGGMLALGLNGAPGADINLTTGDHELVIQNAAPGDMGEKMVVFVIQP